jgi:hypothetical protein
MAKQMLRIVTGLVGLFNALLGLGFLVDPARLAARFALSPLGPQGLATIRADFTAFFLTGAVFALISAWRAAARPLLIPLMLLGTALTGRFISLAVDGTTPTAFPPMIAEAAMIVVLLVAYRNFDGRNVPGAVSRLSS